MLSGCSGKTINKQGGKSAKNRGKDSRGNELGMAKIEKKVTSGSMGISAVKDCVRLGMFVKLSS